ncbi:hypothetical protein ACOMHN_062014 [Nucella lapillus]
MSSAVGAVTDEYKKVSCIAQSAEKYMTFTLNQLSFFDSAQHMMGALQSLAGSLSSCPITEEYFDPSLVRKGVYPYEYMDSWERFDEESLPPKDTDSFILDIPTEDFYKDMMQSIGMKQSFDMKMEPHTGPPCHNLGARSPQGATNVRQPRGHLPEEALHFLGHFGDVQRCLSIGPPTKPPTDDSNCSVAEPDSEPSEHNHSPLSPGTIAAHRIIKDAHDRVKQRPEEPLQRIYNQVLEENLREHPDQADSLVSSVPTFQSCRSSLHRARKTQEPALPKTRSEIVIPEDCTVTADGRLFLQTQDGEDNKILIFATDNAVARICSSESVFMIGTFYTCPRLFYQLFSIHVECNGQLFPMMFTFLPDKSQLTYQRLFRLMKARAAVMGLEFAPSKVRTDFEQAIIMSVRLEFPRARVVGCLFHFCQALWKKVKALGGVVQYKEDEETRKYIRRCAALAFVPIERLDEAWLEIQAGVEDEPLTTAFSDYFVTTWLDDVDSRFPRSVWNHKDNLSTGNMRTNNSLESWHRNLKSLVGSAHPNIFKIVRNLKKEQSRVDTSLRALRLGQQVARSPHKAIRRKNQRLERLKEQFDQGQKTLMDFIDACSYAIHM